MTVEAYEIGVALMFDSNIGQSLRVIQGGFEIIDKIIKGTQGSLDKMTGGLKTMQSAATSAAAAWEKAAAAMERASAAAVRGGAGGFPMPGGGGGGGGVGGGYFPPLLPAPGPRTPQGRISYQDNLRLAYGGGGGGGGGGLGPFGGGAGFGGGGPAPSAGGGGSSSSGLIGAAKWFAAFEAFKLGKDAIGADFAVGQTLTSLQMQGFSPAEVEQAYQAAVSTQQSVGGSTLGGNLSLIGMLMAILQRPGQSIQALPDFAKLGQVLSSQGQGDAGTELFAAMRAGEFRGVLTTKDPITGQDVISPERLAKFTRELSATDIASHGTIGPAEVLRFLRAGGVSSAMIDDESLFADQMALINALGPSGAGTALQGFGMQFSSGRMSEAAFNLLKTMGIINPNTRIVKDASQLRPGEPGALKAGMGQFVLLPGAMSMSDVQLGRDKPADFIMQRLLPSMQGWMHKEYGAAYDNADEAHKQQMALAAAQTIASRIPGGKEIAETIRNILLIDRDREAIRKQMNGPDPFTVLEAMSPMQAQKTAGAAWDAMGIAWARLAEPGIVAGLKGATDFANALANAANYLKSSQSDGTAGSYGEVLAHPLSSNLMMSPLQAWVMQKLDAWFGGGAVPVTVTNGKDLVDSVTKRQADQANTPAYGAADTDPRYSPYGPSH